MLHCNELGDYWVMAGIKLVMAETMERELRAWFRLPQPISNHQFQGSRVHPKPSITT